jgi:glycerophosphoryl diester phosphodiesterase
MSLALPPVIGHRGAAGLAPENTCAGLRRARALDCAMVEFDVRICADGRPVLMHDATVDRTTDGTGPVTALTLAEFARLDAGSWFDSEFAGEAPPTLEQALAECARIGLGAMIEVKRDYHGPGREPKAAIEAIGRLLGDASLQAAATSVLSSFDVELVAWCRRVIPQIRRMVASPRLSDETFRQAERLGCMAVVCDARFLQPGDAGRAHRAGFAVLAYTVNDPVRARKIRGWNVDSIVSDRPDRILGI